MNKLPLLAFSGSSIFRIFVILGFFFILLDRPIQYFFNSLAGVELRSNLVLPIIVVFLIFVGKASIPIKGWYFHSFAFFYFGLISGALLLDELGVQEVIEAISVVFPFLIGIFFSREISRERGCLPEILLMMGGGIAILSLMAIPLEIFPVIFQLHEVSGEVLGRPEIFTDQNFHIMYVFWMLPLVFLLKSRWHYICWLMICLVNAYILSKLWSRSGVVYYAFFASCVLFLGWYKQLIKYSPVILIALVVLGAFLWTNIVTVAESTEIYSRFVDQSTATGGHRLHSVTFLFSHFFDFKYWLPFGSSEFTENFGDIPHSNPTAFYVNSGILGVFGFAALYVVPLVLLTIKLRNFRKIDLYLYICISGMFLVQLSLNLPYNEQVWFWCGVGTFLATKFYAEGQRQLHQI